MLNGLWILRLLLQRFKHSFISLLFLLFNNFKWIWSQIHFSWTCTTSVHKVLSLTLYLLYPPLTQILIECHDSPSGSHVGVKRTLTRVITNFFWKNAIVCGIVHCLMPKVSPNQVLQSGSCKIIIIVAYIRVYMGWYHHGVFHRSSPLSRPNCHVCCRWLFAQICSLWCTLYIIHDLQSCWTFCFHGSSTSWLPSLYCLW